MTEAGRGERKNAIAELFTNRHIHTHVHTHTQLWADKQKGGVSVCVCDTGIFT